MSRRLIFLVALFCIRAHVHSQDHGRARDYGIEIGVMPTGSMNSITDVVGVLVGHCTLIEGNDIRTGVTAILPHQGNIYQEKTPAAVFTGNGFGKLAGSTQVNELGNLETPIILTNTLSVSTAISALVDYTLNQPGNKNVVSVNALVGETNDAYLNNIRKRSLSEKHIIKAIADADNSASLEGSIGAGTGTTCFGYKGGIGSSSRKLPASLGGYTVGVLVQTNYGGVMQIDGVPVGKELGKFSFREFLYEHVDGSCMIVIATDAPLDHRNLMRLAKRAFLGIGKTGGIVSNGSGDYVIAFSTDSSLRIAHHSDSALVTQSLLRNDETSPLFMAAIEATEEAIINSLFKANTIKGYDGHTSEALPIGKVLSILKKYNRITP